MEYLQIARLARFYQKQLARNEYVRGPANPNYNKTDIIYDTNHKFSEANRAASPVAESLDNVGGGLKARAEHMSAASSLINCMYRLHRAALLASSRWLTQTVHPSPPPLSSSTLLSPFALHLLSTILEIDTPAPTVRC